MISKLKRIAALLLALLTVTTGGLYVAANVEALSDWARGLLAPQAKALGAPGSEAEAAGPDEAAEAVPVPLVAAPAPEAEQAAPPQPLPLTAFALADMLSLVPEDCGQVIYILAQGSEGNLWLAQRQEGQWKNAMGPVYCRIGEGELSVAKTDGDSTTPLGWMTPGSLYADRPVDTAWPAEAIAAGARWATDPDSSDYNRLAEADSDQEGLDLATLGGLCLDLGWNAEAIPGRGSAVFLCAGDLGAATGGSVAIKAEDLTRLLGLLDPDQSLEAGIFPALAAGWQIDTGVPGDFASLGKTVPGIRLEPRYATEDNFMGRPIDGYQGYDIYVRTEVAQALGQVQAALEPQGLGLLVYDGYRPSRAVADIFKWLRSDAPGNREAFYPELEKSDLAGVYLAENSPHRKGIAVDLTLCLLESGQPLDMGTPFDFFSASSWTNARGLSDEQRDNRKTLQRAMATGGFQIYSREWWHFNYTGWVVQSTPRDFVIPQ